ncbi:hypothetical protein [Paraclostridium bifermentans]|uniref:hypothetical protein n=1 Tax=Paraclostridium bifermentans TaxID=1490 RepID=UPI00374ED576
MNIYSKSNKDYNLEIHIRNKGILESLEKILNQPDINSSELIDIINILADFIQYNEVHYNEVNEFIYLADCIVCVIENFNNGEINLSCTSEIIYKALKCFMSFLEDKVEIELIFYGTDKYKLLDKIAKLNITYVTNIEEYLKNTHDKFKINILLYSDETANLKLQDELNFNEIIYYDKVMNYMFNISEKIYYSNYDYNYLTKSLEKSKESQVEAIVVGNSYPLTGIIEDLLDIKSIKLALSSQDLYYSYKLAKLSIENNSNIKKCIIGAGYYLVNHDLSRSRSEYSVNLVKNTYYPILRDKHNATNVEEVELLNISKVIDNNSINYIFDLDILDLYFKDLIYRDNKGYFNTNFTREMNSALRGVKLTDISENDKIRLGTERANQHNKLETYTETYKEYKDIFKSFLTFLKDNKVEPIIVVFPNTLYYKNSLSPNYEREFYSIINEIDKLYDIKFVDFSKIDIFDEVDFIDFDHMSELGAIKITKELNKYI